MRSTIFNLTEEGCEKDYGHSFPLHSGIIFHFYEYGARSEGRAYALSHISCVGKSYCLFIWEYTFFSYISVENLRLKYWVNLEGHLTTRLM